MDSGEGRLVGGQALTVAQAPRSGGEGGAGGAQPPRILPTPPPRSTDVSTPARMAARDRFAQNLQRHQQRTSLGAEAGGVVPVRVAAMAGGGAEQEDPGYWEGETEVPSRPSTVATSDLGIRSDVE